MPPPTSAPGGATRGIAYEEQLLFERGSPGPQRRLAAGAVPAGVDPGRELPAALLRGEIAELPALGELEVVRHFTRLAPGTTGSTPGSTRSAPAR